MIRARRLPRKRPGDAEGIQLELGDDEFHFLQALPTRLREVLLDPESAPRVIDRLFPPAHEDAMEDAEHRRLLGRSLYHERLEALERYESSFQGAELDPLTDFHELTLGAAELDVWLHVLNDLRLLIATELDIRDNDWFEQGPRNSEDAIRFQLLASLSAVQEILLAALMGGEGRTGSAG